METCQQRLIDYGKQSSIHGLRYILDDKYSICTRIFWFNILILSCIATFIIFNESYNSYVNRSISFATETTYLNWNTSFPAISICEVWYKNKFWDKLNKYEPISKSSLQEFLSETVFFTGQCYSCGKIKNCLDCNNYLDLRKSLFEFRLKCPDILFKCFWNDEEFKCCDYFLPLKTEYGVCFTINSLHTKGEKKTNLKMISNRYTKPGHLKLITTQEDLMISVHSPEDVPFINQDPSLREIVNSGKKLTILFSLNEINNDKGIRNVNINQRGCLYPDEIPNSLTAYKYYSYSTCIVQCRINNHMKFCNCTHHLMPNVYANTFCNVSQLICLTKYYETLNRIRAKGYGKKGLICDCMPSCEEPDYKVILRSSSFMKNSDDIRFSIKMQALPTQRFKRNVVRTKLDLVVTVGGILGLFFGGSALSLAEPIYFFFIRRSNNKKS